MKTTMMMQLKKKIFELEKNSKTRSRLILRRTRQKQKQRKQRKQRQMAEGAQQRQHVRVMIQMAKQQMMNWKMKWTRTRTRTRTIGIGALMVIKMVNEVEVVVMKLPAEYECRRPSNQENRQVTIENCISKNRKISFASMLLNYQVQQPQRKICMIICVRDATGGIGESKSDLHRGRVVRQTHHMTATPATLHNSNNQHT
jgi:hypothetical protein